ncbi:MAG: helix-turn-helix transcriptional regulator [Actinomycetota bacterium]
MDRAPKTPGDATRKEIGGRIREQRVFLGLTQAEVAEPLQVTKAAVSDWERGVSLPRQHLQVALAEKLNMSWSVLFRPSVGVS